MELIDRYVFAVTRYLPEKQREDIEEELRSLIDDMLVERAGNAQASSEDIEAVLKELGEPSALAAKYSGKKRYLIGPELFDTYIRILKIVPAAAVFGMLVAAVANYATAPPQNLGEVFGNIIDSIFSTAIQAFAWVTLIFAFIEHAASDNGNARRKKREWKPTDLPEIPVKRAMIKRSKPIVAIIFIVIFGVLINFAPGLFSIYSSMGGVPNTTLFNLDVLRTYLPLINIGITASIIKEIVRLVYGRYNLRLAVTTIILSSLSFVLAIIVFSNIHIWNWEFVSSIQYIFGASLPAGYNVTQAVMIFANVVLGIIILSFAMETVKTVSKTIKFGMPDIKRFTNRNR